ncbi:MAG: peptide ABC transporter ATP-binding protein, partial [Caldilineae bacterium]
HPRCRYAEPICSQEHPQLIELRPDHFVACHRAAELQLEGIV